MGYWGDLKDDDEGMAPPTAAAPVAQRFPSIVYNVPEHTREALQLWIDEGQLPGDFVRSVLENDLRNAVTRADFMNAGRLKDIIDFLNMEAPSPCWGSRENVLAWALRFAQEREKP